MLGRTSFRRPPTGTFTQVSAGFGHACAVRTTGSVVCWGDKPLVGKSSAPPSGQFRSVSVAKSGFYFGFYCAIRVNGALLCWGETTDASTLDSLDIAPPALAFTQVSAGESAACGVSAGAAICWRNMSAPRDKVPASFRQCRAGVWLAHQWQLGLLGFWVR